MAEKRKLPNFEMDAIIKIEFLRELENRKYSISQYNVSCSFLKKIDKYESLVGVPCYKYQQMGLLDMLASFNSSSLNSLKTILSVLRLYIVFANDQLGLNNVSVLSIESDALAPLVNAFSKNDKYITRNEYVNILKTKNCNYVDLAQIVFLYHGIKGENYKEMLEYEIKDFTGHSLIYKDEEIELDELEINIIKNTILEKSYQYYDRYNNTGELREVELEVNSKYLFKSSIHFNSDNKLSANSIKARLGSFLNTRLQMPSLTGKGIIASSIVYRALEQNDFQEMPRAELDRKCKEIDKYNQVAYVNLNQIQEIILNKIRNER